MAVSTARSCQNVPGGGVPSAGTRAEERRAGVENKKTLEELADEALDAVSGGKTVILRECKVCGRQL